ncbi:hypothetical protein NPX99_05465 [Bartonella sp. 220]|uniref:hypothetical protein n=1 Tax=Bartonella sp. 220B TaxID=2967260 RepID=UPI0022A99608|nr:hypothetical protein [Bartonella sp. 220B]MCZ2158721.1 hypothetical protein [Bartonella sp. 220B]
MKQDAVLDKKQLSLSWQDYKRIFYILTVMITGLTVISYILKFAWWGDFFSFFILQLLAWVFAFAIFFLPTILLLRIRVTRKSKTMIQQLQEETQ